MFNQSNYSDTYEREKLLILQTLNDQIQSMAVKLDHIVSQVEENVFKIKPSTTSAATTTTASSSSSSSSSSTENPTTTAVTSPSKMLTLDNALSNSVIIQQPTSTVPSGIINADKPFELSNNHQIVKIVDEPINETNLIVNKPKRTNNNRNKQRAKTLLDKKSQLTPVSITADSSNDVKPEPEAKLPDTTAKRNKQQRQFNTFVRESINQLMGADFMKTHDVQDIDQQVMEMIRKEAVENYLPDNIRPRRAWHLAKASLRTLKRTLNNKKT